MSRQTPRFPLSSIINLSILRTSSKLKLPLAVHQHSWHWLFLLFGGFCEFFGVGKVRPSTSIRKQLKVNLLWGLHTVDGRKFLYHNFRVKKSIFGTPTADFLFLRCHQLLFSLFFPQLSLFSVDYCHKIVLHLGVDVVEVKFEGLFLLLSIENLTHVWCHLSYFFVDPSEIYIR